MTVCVCVYKWVCRCASQRCEMPWRRESQAAGRDPVLLLGTQLGSCARTV